MQTLTLVNRRGGKSGGKKQSYGKALKGSIKGYGTATALTATGAGVGLLGTAWLAGKFAGNDKNATASDNLKAKRLTQIALRGGSLAAGVLLAPISLPFAIGLGAAGLIGLTRSAAGAIDKENKLLNIAQEAVERDYGIDDIEKDIDNATAVISAQLDQAAGGMAGLGAVGKPTVVPARATPSQMKINL